MHPSPPPGPAHATSPSSRRLLRQLAGQVGLSQIAHRSRSALEKTHDRRSDNRTENINPLSSSAAHILSMAVVSPDSIARGSSLSAPSALRTWYPLSDQWTMSADLPAGISRSMPEK